jgi:hypothetical protein
MTGERIRSAVGKRRRQRRQDHSRPVVQKVTLTVEQQQALRVRATELGVSVPLLMVSAALSDQPSPNEDRAALRAFFEIIRLLATVANNVNQLAHIANIERNLSREHELTEVLGEIKDVLERLRQAIRSR